MPEALDLNRALSKHFIVVAIYMYMLNYVFPLVAKQSRTLQTEHLDLSVASSLFNTTLHTLVVSVYPSANWVLQLLDECKHLEEVSRITVTQAVIT